MRTRMFSGLLAVIAVCAGAQAADLGPRPGYTKAQEMLVAAPYNWTFLFFGGQLGGSFAAQPLSTSATGFLADIGNPGSIGPNAVGIDGGGHIGFNYQMGGTNIVVGAEFDAELSSLSSNNQLTFTTNRGAFPVGTSVISKPWDLYAIGKAGFTFGPRREVMLYGFGGGALAELRNETSADPNVGGLFTNSNLSSTNVHGGWTAGGGVDWRVVDNFLLGFRYRYEKLGNNGVIFDAGTNGTFRADQNAASNQFTVRGSFLF